MRAWHRDRSSHSYKTAPFGRRISPAMPAIANLMPLLSRLPEKRALVWRSADLRTGIVADGGLPMPVVSPKHARAPQRESGVRIRARLPCRGLLPARIMRKSFRGERIAVGIGCLPAIPEIVAVAPGAEWLRSPTQRRRISPRPLDCGLCARIYPRACGRTLRSNQFALPNQSQKFRHAIMLEASAVILGPGLFANGVDEISHAGLLM